jgi:hypothetical protein
MKQITVGFKKVQTKGTATTYRRKLNWSGTIDRIKCRFPPGPEGTLQVVPVVERPDGTVMPLLIRDDSGLTDAYLSGDNYEDQREQTAVIELGYTLAVTATNADAVNDHGFVFTAHCTVREVGDRGR